MTKNELHNILGKLFTTRAQAGKDDGTNENADDETIIYHAGAFDKTSDMYAVYYIVSDYANDSGLSHAFSYEIMSRATDVLVEVEDWNDDDAITEAVDSAVPIYTHKLMEIYLNNSWAVDEAREEYGSQDSTKDAQMAWYKLIDDAVHGIKEPLQDLLNK